MTNQANLSTRKYKIIRCFGLFSGITPFVVGIAGTSLYFLNINSLGFIYSFLLRNFNYKVFSKEEIYLSMFSEVLLKGWSCLIINGLSLSILCYIALKKRHRWIWWLILFINFSNVLHDLIIALIKPSLILTPIIPFTLLSLWLIYAKKIIWRDDP